MNEVINQIILGYGFRLARKEDLKGLISLEKEAFEEYRQSNQESINRTISSDKQILCVKESDDHKICASLTLRVYKEALRIMSIAVLKDYQGKGYGLEMLKIAKDIGKVLSCRRLILEGDASNYRLIEWYEDFGFEQEKVLNNYYKEDSHAIRMVMYIDFHGQNVVVTDYDTDFFDQMDTVKHIRANEYFENQAFYRTKNTRVFNFCQSYDYQSIGYYVSLLGLARNQVTYPSAGFLRDIHNHQVIKSVGQEINDLIQKTFKGYDQAMISINSFFGRTENPTYQKLINSLNRLYRTPLVSYHFILNKQWDLSGIELISLEDAMKNMPHGLVDKAIQYFEDEGFVRSNFKRHDYDMAILIDPDEQLPPSDRKALEAFEIAAEKTGFYVEYITKLDYNRIPEFDALFIRTTTNVNDYTYDFARYAYAEGLAVIDDPWSILRCANKIYLYETLRNANVKMPRTWILNKMSDYKKVVASLGFPIILKLPDSAFSAGVFKVVNQEQCLEKLDILFTQSELILAQQFLPTDFDWRIGVLDGKPLYACKYYMAGGHWQIVNWQEDHSGFLEGDYEVLPIESIPEGVINTALRAVKTIGDGLYGVDLKSSGQEVYVIEVNDNPSLEYQVEDLIEGPKLYEKIMKSFYDRIENSGTTLRSVT